MTLSDRPLTTSLRCAPALILFCALALLPFGLAQAGEPDYEAVGNRLLKAVAAGELSPDQAEAMMGKLAKVHFAERLAVLKAKVKLKKQGKKAWSKKQGKKAWSKKTKVLAWIPRYLKEIGLDAKQSKQVLWAIKNVVANPEASYSLAPGYLEKLGLTPKQIEQVEGVMKKAVAVASQGKGDHAKRQGANGLGVSDEALAKIRHALHERGLSNKQIPAVLEVLEKLVYVWRNEPKAVNDEFYGEVKAYLGKELGLDGDQIGFVFEIAKKIMAKTSKGEGQGGRKSRIGDHYRKLGIDDSTLKRLAGSLRESGLEGEQIEQALGGIARLLHGQLKPDAPRDELRAGLVKHFKKAGFSAEQIEHMVGLSKRIFPRVKERMQGLAKEKKSEGDDPEEGFLRAYSELGISKEVLGKVRQALKEFGLDAKQSQGALYGMIRVLYGMKLKAKGKEFKLDSRLRGYFQKELGLSPKQVEQIVGLCEWLNGIQRVR